MNPVDIIDWVDILSECYGAMWPGLGLPRGTPPLVVWENFYGFYEIRTLDLWSGWRGLARLGHQPTHSDTCKLWFECYI
jgi:hypothetical protein